jgi:hypothetical protein
MNDNKNENENENMNMKESTPVIRASNGELSHEQALEVSRKKAQEAIENIRMQNSHEPQSNAKQRFPFKKVGKVSAILYTVFGSILAVGFGIPVFVTSLLGSPPSLIIGLGVPCSVGLGMGLLAARNFRRISRFNRYLSLLERSDFCLVDELAEYSGLSNRFVTRDLKRMLYRGFLPHAHITKDNSMIILTNESYERYIFEQRRRKLLSDSINQAQDVEVIAETHSTVIEGREFIAKVNLAIASIQDNEVKGKIIRLESIVTQILNHVEKHPEQAGNLRRFIEYYLPSILKMLSVYKELESHTLEGSNITTTKVEIKNSLDVINQGFETLFNNLFAGISIDISSDISVLNTLLTADGLTKV